jgi:hypothetical protein
VSKWYEIWRVGNYPQGNFTEDDVQQIMDNYRPEESEAPLVIGHPENEDKAYGWVEALKREGAKLLAKFKQVAPEFVEAVNQGRYKKVSVRLRKKENGWNLIHVGFLGAARPQVEGLKTISFSEVDIVASFRENIVEDKRLALHIKASDFAAREGVSYEEALCCIEANEDFNEEEIVDDGRLALHRKATDFAAREGVSYEEALCRIEADEDFNEEEIADRETLRLHRKILEFTEEHGICYYDALIAVTNKEGL